MIHVTPSHTVPLLHNVAHSDSHGPHLVSNHEGFDGLVARHPTAHQMVSNGFCYSFQSRGERQQLSFIWIFDQARLSPRFAKDDVLRLQVVQNVLAEDSSLLYGYLESPLPFVFGVVCKTPLFWVLSILFGVVSCKKGLFSSKQLVGIYTMLYQAESCERFLVFPV